MPRPMGWPRADGLAAGDAEAPADALADGAADALGLGLGAGVAVRSPPFPSSNPLSRIAVNTATVAITKAFETSSRTWTAFSDGV